MDILKVMIMGKPGKGPWQDLVTMITFLVLQLIQVILRLLLYPHHKGPIEHTLLKMLNQWFIEEYHLLLKMLMIIVAATIKRNGISYQTAFQNQLERLFLSLQQIQRLQVPSTLPITAAYSAL